MDDCRGAGSGVPGGHGAGGVSDAEVFSEHAGRAEKGIQNERAAHGESFGVHGGIDAGRDSEAERTGKGTGAATSHRKRTRGTDGAAERRSNQEHAGGAAGGKRHGDYLQLESGGGAGAGNSRVGIPAVQRGAGSIPREAQADGGVPFYRDDFLAGRGGPTATPPHPPPPSIATTTHHPTPAHRQL